MENENAWRYNKTKTFRYRCLEYGVEVEPLSKKEIEPSQKGGNKHGRKN